METNKRKEYCQVEFPIIVLQWYDDTYRPSYPSEFIHYLINQIGIRNRIVTDITAA